jgi:3-oxoacyl-[acyl-carrier-protein] synthase-1
MTATIVITRAALACPLGLCRRPAVATMRSGLVVFEADELDTDATVSRTSTLAPDLTRIQRIAALMAHALHELTTTVSHEGWREPLPVFIVLPTLDPASLDWLLASVRTALGQRLGVQVLLTRESVIPDSRAGMFTALRWAAQVLAERRFPRIALLAADSLVDPETVRALDRAGLLLGPSNRDGRVPGEGAAALLVEPADRSNRGSRLASLVSLDEIRGADSFERVRTGQQVNIAESLAQLFGRIAAEFPERTDLVVSGQPSESHWGRELSYAYLRNVGLMPEPMRVVQTGVEIGDAGAAAGAIAIVRGLSEFEPSSWRMAPATVLAYAVADDGHAGAALLMP